MKIMCKVVSIFLSIFALVILLFLGYYGLFDNTNIYVSEKGGEYIIFERVIGDYSKTGEISDKLYYKLLNEDNLETFKGIGIYYDNPKKVKKEELRSDIGSILEKNDENKIEELQKKYNIKQIPRAKYIIAEFPVKGKISYIIGIFKIYPKLNEYANNNGYLEDSIAIEIYDIPNNKIIYMKEALKKD